MKRLTAIAATTLALTLTTALAAQAGPRGGEGRGEAMLAEIDTNKDGALSKNEISAHRASEFAAIDTNRDGAASKEELATHHEKRTAERRGKRQDAMLAKLDSDKNGTVSAAEFSARPMPGFDKMDADGDGSISAAEREAAKGKMKERRGQWRDKPAGE